MKLSSIMNRYPQTIAFDAPLLRARNFMLWGGFRHLPVVDGDSGTLMGLVTERDIAKHQARTPGSLVSCLTDPVAIAMSTAIHTADPEETLTIAAARMAAEKIGCLPIVERGKFVGIVTTTDVLAAQTRIDGEPNGSPGKTVAEVMTGNPYLIRPEDKLLDAAARMRQYRIRHLPVVDSEKRVVGMLSDRDVRAAITDPTLSTPEQERMTTALYVSDIMSTPVVTTDQHETCAATARTFLDRDCGAIPVVDEEDVVIGVVSYMDVLRAFSA